MEFRHEWKHEISHADLLILRQRLRAVCETDAHAVDGVYTIRSLYFDTPTDRALRDKLDGVSRREKFRIRLYNGDASTLRLEKKSKRGGLCNKQSAALTEETARALAAGDTGTLRGSDQPLLRELYLKMTMQGLRPRTIVDYTREPYVYAPGNVRVTLDYDIRTGLRCTEFLDPDCVTIPAGGAPILLEVKWDEFLPSVIRSAVHLPNRRAGAFSKYAACRIYG